MKEKLMAMYEAQMIDASGLLKAVERGWVTIGDVVEIVGEDNALSFIMAAKLAEISNMCNAVIVAGVDIELGESNGMTNGEVDIALSIIKESYEKHMRNHTFMEDARGYPTPK